MYENYWGDLEAYVWDDFDFSWWWNKKLKDSLLFIYLPIERLLFSSGRNL